MKIVTVIYAEVPTGSIPPEGFNEWVKQWNEAIKNAVPGGIKVTSLILPSEYKQKNVPYAASVPIPTVTSLAPANP